MREIIYIRLPRCGSTSVAALSERNGFTIVGCGLGFDGIWTKKDKEFKQHPMLSVISPRSENPLLIELVKEHIGKEKYNNSFTFSSVRNPYSRAVSMWQHGSWFKHTPTFSDFCKALCESGISPIFSKNRTATNRARWHTCSTGRQLLGDNDEILVDYICKMETLQADIDKMFNMLGIERQEVPRLNVGLEDSQRLPTQITSKHYTEWYTPELKDIISKKYEKDIEFFEYTFEGGFE